MSAGAEETAVLLLGEIVRQCIREGFPVSIDGLGIFRRNESGEIEFSASDRARIFLAYVEEDYPAASRLYDSLARAGFDPWLDKRKLLPGQDWPACIEREIAMADFFMPCFSARALRKRGQFQRELRLALDTARAMPLDDVFIIPVRLEACEVPRSIRSLYQYVDLFPAWDAAVDRIVLSIRDETTARARHVDVRQPPCFVAGAQYDCSRCEFRTRGRLSGQGVCALRRARRS